MPRGRPKKRPDLALVPVNMTSGSMRSAFEPTKLACGPMKSRNKICEREVIELSSDESIEDNIINVSDNDENNPYIFNGYVSPISLHTLMNDDNERMNDDILFAILNLIRLQSNKRVVILSPQYATRRRESNIRRWCQGDIENFDIAIIPVHLPDIEHWTLGIYETGGVISYYDSIGVDDEDDELIWVKHHLRYVVKSLLNEDNIEPAIEIVPIVREVRNNNARQWINKQFGGVNCGFHVALIAEGYLLRDRETWLRNFNINVERKRILDILSGVVNNNYEYIMREEYAVSLSVTQCELWKHFKVFHLKENKRAMQSNENTMNVPEQIDFADFILRMGNGELKTDEDEYIEIPGSCITDDLIYSVFGKSIEQKNYVSMCKRVILTTTNDKALAINNDILEEIKENGQKMRTYLSIDKVDVNEPKGYLEYPQEYLHSINESGLPPHELKIFENCPVILLRNLNPAAGLCNGTRMLVKRMHKYHLECELLTGEKAGQRVLIPRITLTSSKEKIPFTLYRKQFPLKTSYAMTINKSQGQTIEYVGIDLEDPVFAHGQAYVAFSRARAWEHICVAVNRYYISKMTEGVRAQLTRDSEISQWGIPTAQKQLFRKNIVMEIVGKSSTKATTQSELMRIYLTNDESIYRLCIVRVTNLKAAPFYRGDNERIPDGLNSDLEFVYIESSTINVIHQSPLLKYPSGNVVPPFRKQIKDVCLGDIELAMHALTLSSPIPYSVSIDEASSSYGKNENGEKKGVLFWIGDVSECKTQLFVECNMGEDDDKEVIQCVEPGTELLYMFGRALKSGNRNILMVRGTENIKPLENKSLAISQTTQFEEHKFSEAPLVKKRRSAF